MKHKLSKLSPLLFTLFGFISLSFVSINQFMKPRPKIALFIQLATIIFYVVYMGFESKISFKEMDKQESDDFDLHTMELAAIVKISLLFSCLGIGNTWIPVDYHLHAGIMGLLLMFLGFFLRGKSILDLGESYGHRIRPIYRDVHQKGIYSIIRHGAYTGTFFIHLGVTINFLNIFSAALIFAWLIVVIIRIQLEDKLLMKDDRYKIYAKKTKYKMIPFIW